MQPVRAISTKHTIVSVKCALVSDRRIILYRAATSIIPDALLDYSGIHSRKQGIAENVARGIALFLNSTIANRQFSSFSGQRGVHAADLRHMRFPKKETLLEFGNWASSRTALIQTAIDAYVEGFRKILLCPFLWRAGALFVPIIPIVRAAKSLKKGTWKLALPFASAILTILYPDDFTVYDRRVCSVLGLPYHPNGRFSDAYWAKYQQYKARVIKNTPVELSLRNKDRFLWAKSFWQDAIKNAV